MSLHHITQRQKSNRHGGCHERHVSRRTRSDHHRDRARQDRRKEFNSFSSLSWVVTAYMLTTTVTVPLAGKMSDIFGRRKVLLTGVTIFVLGRF